MACCRPPLAQIPAGTWLCRWCSRCRHCGRTAGPTVPFTHGSHSATCDDCYRLAGGLCNLCGIPVAAAATLPLEQTDGGRASWTRCSRCCLPVHAACGGTATLSVHSDQRHGMTPEFVCRLCRPVPAAAARRDVSSVTLGTVRSPRPAASLQPIQPVAMPRPESVYVPGSGIRTGPGVPARQSCAFCGLGQTAAPQLGPLAYVQPSIWTHAQCAHRAVGVNATARPGQIILNNVTGALDHARFVVCIAAHSEARCGSRWWWWWGGRRGEKGALRVGL